MELAETIRQIALEAKTPKILKNVDLKWPIFSQTLREWCETFDKHLNEKVIFDIGAVGHFDCPYWERFRATHSMTLVEFLDNAQSGALKDKWATYSYQDIDSWPHEIRKDINFNASGFDNVEDILFWIGSKGANTPCHYDTYGINIVVQVFGRCAAHSIALQISIKLTHIDYVLGNDGFCFHLIAQWKSHESRMKSQVFIANKISTAQLIWVNSKVKDVL